MLVSEKHSNLFYPFVGYEEKSLITLAPDAWTLLQPDQPDETGNSIGRSYCTYETFYISKTI
jgi:hypothetical protein